MPPSREERDRRHFDSIAEHYSQKDLRAYSRRARRARLLRSIKNVPKPISSLLEVGCGAGFTAEYLKGQYAQYVGLDFSAGLIAYANKLNRLNGVHFVRENIKDFKTDARFSVILMIGVLHHIPEPASVIRSLGSILEMDGVIIVNEPQKGNPIISLMRKIRKRIDSHYSDEQIELRSDDLRKAFLECGYSVTVFPQGIFSTPLAETGFLPNWVGVPLSVLANFLDPMMEGLLSLLGLDHLAWNFVLEARSAQQEIAGNLLDPEDLVSPFSSQRPARPAAGS